jgi:hypothetical protein
MAISVDKSAQIPSLRIIPLAASLLMDFVQKTRPRYIEVQPSEVATDSKKLRPDWNRQGGGRWRLHPFKFAWHRWPEPGS